MRWGRLIAVATLLLPCPDTALAAIARFNIREAETREPISGVAVLVMHGSELVGYKTTGDDGWIEIEVEQPTEHEVWDIRVVSGGKFARLRSIQGPFVDEVGQGISPPTTSLVVDPGRAIEASFLLDRVGKPSSPPATLTFFVYQAESGDPVDHGTVRLLVEDGPKAASIQSGWAALPLSAGQWLIFRESGVPLEIRVPGRDPALRETFDLPEDEQPIVVEVRGTSAVLQEEPRAVRPALSLLIRDSGTGKPVSGAKVRLSTVQELSLEVVRSDIHGLATTTRQPTDPGRELLFTVSRFGYRSPPPSVVTVPQRGPMTLPVQIKRTAAASVAHSRANQVVSLLATGVSIVLANYSLRDADRAQEAYVSASEREELLKSYDRWQRKYELYQVWRTRAAVSTAWTLFWTAYRGVEWELTDDNSEAHNMGWTRRVLQWIR